MCAEKDGSILNQEVCCNLKGKIINCNAADVLYSKVYRNFWTDQTACKLLPTIILELHLGHFVQVITTWFPKPKSAVSGRTCAHHFRALLPSILDIIAKYSGLNRHNDSVSPFQHLNFDRKLSLFCSFDQKYTWKVNLKLLMEWYLLAICHSSEYFISMIFSFMRSWKLFSIHATKDDADYQCNTFAWIQIQVHFVKFFLTLFVCFINWSIVPLPWYSLLLNG